MDFEYSNEIRSNNEKWDPSMSNDGPWNEESFIEDHIEHLNALEKKLGYTEEQLETIYDNQDVLQKFETEFQNRYEQVYDSIFVKGYNTDADELEVTDAYRTIEKTVTDEIGYLNYKELRKKLDEALFNHTVEKYLDIFKGIYDKYLSSNEGLHAVQAGEIVKLQRPHDNTYTNITINSDGIELGDCDGCGAKTVNIKEHICKTIVNNNMGEKLNKMVTRIDWFKTSILEDKEDKEKNELDVSGEIEYQTERLLSKYKEQFLDEIENIFPAYKTKEYDDALEYIIDFIYDQENIEDSEWNLILDVLTQKIKKILL